MKLFKRNRIKDYHDIKREEVSSTNSIEWALQRVTYRIKDNAKHMDELESENRQILNIMFAGKKAKCIYEGKEVVFEISHASTVKGSIFFSSVEKDEYKHSMYGCYYDDCVVLN